MARLASLLATAQLAGELERVGEHEAQALLAGLGAAERDDLVRQLATQPAPQLLPLLRALLSLPELRLLAVRTAIRLVQEGRLTGKLAFSCLSELRVAIARHWERRERGGGGVRIGSMPPARPPPPRAEEQEARLQELLTLCGDVLSSILPPSAVCGTRDEVAASRCVPAPAGAWGEGHALAVQLLPPLLRAADSLHAATCAEQARARPPAPRCASLIRVGGTDLAEGHASKRALQPVLCAVEDFVLQREQRLLLMDKIQRILSQLSDAPHATPRHDQRTEGARWASLLYQLVALCPAAELPPLIWSIETSLRHSSGESPRCEGGEAVRLVESALSLALESVLLEAVRPAPHADASPHAVAPLPHGEAAHAAPLAAQCASLLLLLQRSPPPPHLAKSLHALLLSHARRLGDTWGSQQRLVCALVSMPAMGARTELLLQLAVHLCHLPTSAPLGAFLMLEVFASVPGAREEILSFVFDSLSQEDLVAQHPLWVALLQQLATRHLLALHAHAHQLHDWSCCLPALPLPTATAVLDALLPLVPLSAGFGRHLLLLLRKQLVSPELRHRHLAIYGFGSLLRRQLLRAEPSSEADAALALRSALGLCPSSCVYALATLHAALAAAAPHDAEARAIVVDTLRAQCARASALAWADGWGEAVLRAALRAGGDETLAPLLRAAAAAAAPPPLRPRLAAAGGGGAAGSESLQRLRAAAAAARAGQGEQACAREEPTDATLADALEAALVSIALPVLEWILACAGEEGAPSFASQRAATATPLDECVDVLRGILLACSEHQRMHLLGACTAILAPHDKRFVALGNLTSSSPPSHATSIDGAPPCTSSLPATLLSLSHAAAVMRRAALAQRGEAPPPALPALSSSHVGGAALLASASLCGVAARLAAHVSAEAQASLLARLERPPPTSGAAAASSDGPPAEAELLRCLRAPMLPPETLLAAVLALLELAAECREWQASAGCAPSGREARLSRRAYFADGEQLELAFKLTAADLEETALRLRTVALQQVSCAMHLLFRSAEEGGDAMAASSGGVGLSSDGLASAGHLALPDHLRPVAERLQLVEEGEMPRPQLSLEQMLREQARQLEEDLRGGISAPLLYAYIRLLEQLGERVQEASSGVVQLCRRILTTYSIEQSEAVRALVHLMLHNHQSAAAASAAAAEVLTRALGGAGAADGCPPHAADSSPAGAPSSDANAQEERDEGEEDDDDDEEAYERQAPPRRLAAEEGSGLRLRATAGVSAAAAQEAIAMWKAQVDLRADGEGLADSDVAASAAVSGKFMALMSALMATALRGSAAVRAEMRRAKSGGDADVPSFWPWLDVWQLLVPLVRSYCTWLQQKAVRWPLAARRRVPVALYHCERLQAQLLSLLQAHVLSGSPMVAGGGGACAGGAPRNCSDERPHSDASTPQAAPINSAQYTQLVNILVDDWTKGAEPAEAGGEMPPQASLGMQGGVSRRRLRSRNPYIDAQLSASRTFDDTFADLEDFIVCKRGRRY
ncbi:hypothetical protein AB1Y20_015789 [Prymnesium parvum]|uniref:FANCI solenoid 2 domain-containing protein n=1 Tax=Prymnesium parvum TaxID=97485 RepID=A0AB34JYR5_PRYPA